jgi:signal transduction histidine kinase
MAPNEPDTYRLLNFAGYLTWAATAFFLLWPYRHGPIPLGMLGVLLAFVLAFGIAAHGHGTPVRHGGLLIVQALSVVALTFSEVGGLGAATLVVVVAAQLPLMLPPRWAVAGLVIQTLLLTAALLLNHPTLPALKSAGLNAGLSLFAFAVCQLLRREHAARQELQQLYGQLAATQALLAQRSREAERLHISREVHDVMGHHLTALILQLEWVVRVSNPRVMDAAQAALGSGRQLLAEVRAVVSTLREERVPSLPEALGELVRGVLSPRVHLEVAPGLEVSERAHVHAVLRCAQEILTNTVRHARAENLWLRLTPDQGVLRLWAVDDGQGCASLVPGLGLTGLRERFEALGGRVSFSAGSEKGLQVVAELPLVGRGGEG